MNLGCYKANEFHTKDAVYSSGGYQLKISKFAQQVIFKTVIKDQQSKWISLKWFSQRLFLGLVLVAEIKRFFPPLLMTLLAVLIMGFKPLYTICISNLQIFIN